MYLCCTSSSVKNLSHLTEITGHIFSYQLMYFYIISFLSDFDKELLSAEHEHKAHLIMCVSRTICASPIVFIF